MKRHVWTIARSLRTVAFVVAATQMFVVVNPARANTDDPAPFMGGTFRNVHGQKVGSVSFEQSDDTPPHIYVNVEMLGRAGFANRRSSVVLLAASRCQRSAGDAVLADMSAAEAAPVSDVQLTNGSAMLVAGTMYSMIGKTVMIYAHGGRHQTYCTKVTHPMR